MNVLGNVLAALLAVFAAFLCCTNAASIVVSLRNARRGVDPHVSMVPFVPQPFVLLAFLGSRRSGERWFPAWLLLAIALADVSLWCLLYLPIALLRRRR